MGKKKTDKDWFSMGITQFCNYFKYERAFNRQLIVNKQKSIGQKLREVVSNLSRIDSQAIANFGNLLSASGDQNLIRNVGSFWGISFQQALIRYATSLIF
jgi:hypothetical protein